MVNLLHYFWKLYLTPTTNVVCVLSVWKCSSLSAMDPSLSHFFPSFFLNSRESIANGLSKAMTSWTMNFFPYFFLAKLFKKSGFSPTKSRVQSHCMSSWSYVICRDLKKYELNRIVKNRVESCRSTCKCILVFKRYMYFHTLCKADSNLGLH